MQGIYIASTTPRAGKNLLAFSLGILLQRANYTVGYMKPMGAHPQQVEEQIGDTDALIAQELLGQNAAPSLVTPVMLPANLHLLSALPPEADSGYLKRIEHAYQTLSAGKDLMIVCGTHAFPATGRFCQADGLAIAQALGLNILLIERYNRNFNTDALLYLKDLLHDSLLGVVLNDVPEEKVRDATNLLVPYLAGHDIPVHGIVPQETGLTAMRVQDLAHGLSGYIVAGNNQASRMIKDFFIGTMQVDNFMIHLRRHAGHVVIVGGDRADLQLAALHCQSPCIILTGNFTPSDLVRSKADALGIPLISVKEDTYTVAQTMTNILRNKKLRDLNQIRLGISLIEKTLSIDSIIHRLITRQSV